MKFILFLITLFLCSPIFAQKSEQKIELPSKDGKVLFTEVVTTKDSLKKAKIYLAAKEWISRSFKDSKSVIDYEDKEEGKIICKGSFEGVRKGSNKFTSKFTMDFTIKDNKYRIQMYNIEVKEYHYEVLGGGLNPYLPFSDINIDLMNDDYVNNVPKPKYKRKYSEEYLAKTALVLLSISDDAKKYIAKSSSEKSDSDF